MYHDVKSKLMDDEKIDQKNDQKNDQKKTYKNNKQNNKLFKLLKAQIENQKRFINEYKGERNELMGKVLNKIDEERQGILSELSARDGSIIDKISTQIKGVKKISIYTTGSIILFLGGLILFLFLITLYYSRSREAMIQQYQERILSKMKDYNPKNILSNEPFEGDELPEMLNELPDLLINKDEPLGRMRGIEVIDAELVENDEKDVGKKLLEPFLNDENIDVKAKAIEVLFKYDCKQAFEKINKLMKDPNRNVKLRAIKMVKKISGFDTQTIEEQLYMEKIIEQFIGLEKDQDNEIKKEVYKILFEIYRKKKDCFSNNFRNKIEDFLDGAQKNWVIE